jgi:hypothetical protein
MEHKPQKIEINPRREGEPPSSIHLFVDGHEIKGIRKLDFSVEPNGFPHLVLDLQAFDLTVDADCLIYQAKIGAINLQIADEENERGDNGWKKKDTGF